MSDENPIYTGDGKKKKHSLSWGLLIIVLPVLIVVASVALFATGSLSLDSESGIGLGKTNKGANYTIVCDSSIIDDYNAAMYYKIRGNDTTPTLDEQGVKDVKKNIEGRNEYAGDPSCQAMLFWIAIHFADTKGARTAYDAEYAMHEDRIFADSNIRGNLPLFDQLETLVVLESPKTDEL